MTIRDISGQDLSLNRSPFAATRGRWLIVGDRVVVCGSDQFGDAERIRISGE